eukprot:GHVL01034050.1.p1 GENE.GHVL01034050.1~~GHVL01034050.1.p1  ORF type:complete len:361 (-),score=69.15 GHVL01034050.1:77-1159(-)
MSEVKTLWIGDVDAWMDETWIVTVFSEVAMPVNAKLIRDRASGLPAGYGFVEFASPEDAQKVLDELNGKTIPGMTKRLRLNWASFGIGQGRTGTGQEYSLFVGDLDPTVNDYSLSQVFSKRYKSVSGSKVIFDANGVSKGYGFVRFVDRKESERALVEMNGYFVVSKPIRVSVATQKRDGVLGMEIGMGGHSLSQNFTSASGYDGFDYTSTSSMFMNTDNPLTDDISTRIPVPQISNSTMMNAQMQMKFYNDPGRPYSMWLMDPYLINAVHKLSWRQQENKIEERDDTDDPIPNSLSDLNKLPRRTFEEVPEASEWNNEFVQSAIKAPHLYTKYTLNELNCQWSELPATTSYMTVPLESF